MFNLLRKLFGAQPKPKSETARDAVKRYLLGKCVFCVFTDDSGWSKMTSVNELVDGIFSSIAAANVLDESKDDDDFAVLIAAIKDAPSDWYSAIFQTICTTALGSERFRQDRGLVALCHRLKIEFDRD